MSNVKKPNEKIDHVDLTVSAAVKGALAATALLLACGCTTPSYTLEEARILMGPYYVDENDLGPATVPGPTIEPPPADRLVGQWVGEEKKFLVSTLSGPTAGRYGYEVTFSYVFKRDGTFSFTSTDTYTIDSPLPVPGAQRGPDGKWRYPNEGPNYIGSGTWRYSNGDLDLVESGKRIVYYKKSFADKGRATEVGSCKDVVRRLHVFWKNNDEIAIRYRTPQDLLDGLTNVGKMRGGKVPDKVWCGYDKKDGSEVWQEFRLEKSDSNRGTLYFFKTTQSNIHRVLSAEERAKRSSGRAGKPADQAQPSGTGAPSHLAIDPLSLVYDEDGRCGKLVVKFNAAQAAEARAWIRKNFETLARDKNIPLTTGDIPPAARFLLGREELKEGNILEIEFKTE